MSARDDVVPARKVHELKTWPEAFASVVAGEKTHEIRRDDRGFTVGDVLRLREWVPGYSGRSVDMVVTHVTRDSYGLPPDLCVMSIRVCACPTTVEGLNARDETARAQGGPSRILRGSPVQAHASLADGPRRYELSGDVECEFCKGAIANGEDGLCAGCRVGLASHARDLVAQVRAKYPELGALADALDGGLDEADELEAQARCTVYCEPCPVHGFIHGAEAEELRHSVEGVIASHQPNDPEWPVVSLLQRVLNQVDARDSLAYIEAQETSKAAIGGIVALSFAKKWVEHNPLVDMSDEGEGLRALVDDDVLASWLRDALEEFQSRAGRTRS